jgi:L-threonylcarbamoyladenylate synthase
MIVSVERAGKLIREGQVVALPTETVYGLAADASNLSAVSRIFELKKRPADNPLIVHISDIHQMSLFSDAHQSDIIQKLAKAFWPGPLTVVVPKKASVLDIVTAGLNTVALRMPDHPETLSVIQTSCPVAAPSANLSGRPSPTQPQHVTEDFGDALPIVDGGKCRVGLESTVLDLSSNKPAILRPGAISAKEIEQTLGTTVHMHATDVEQRKKSPGTRYSHYKPHATVRWMSDSPSFFHASDTLYIYHTRIPAEIGPNVAQFTDDFESLARSLYDLYRSADREGYTSIQIEPFIDDYSSPILPALINRIERSVNT